MADLFRPRDADEDEEKQYFRQWKEIATYWAETAKMAGDTGPFSTVSKFRVKGRADNARELAIELRREADDAVARSEAAAKETPDIEERIKQTRGFKRSKGSDSIGDVATESAQLTGAAVAWEKAAGATETADVTGWTAVEASSLAAAVSEVAKLSASAALPSESEVAERWNEAARSWREAAQILKQQETTKSFTDETGGGGLSVSARTAPRSIAELDLFITASGLGLVSSAIIFVLRLHRRAAQIGNAPLLATGV